MASGTTTDNLAALDGAQLVVLSVKPQVLPGVLDQLAGRIPPDALALSIVAGARMETLTGKLRHTALARAMPNTPAQIGMGMTVWTCMPGLDESQRGQARAVFGSFGEEVYVDDERYLDMATALSGTGRRTCSSLWKRWWMRGCTWAFLDVWPSNSSIKRCAEA